MQGFLFMFTRWEYVYAYSVWMPMTSSSPVRFCGSKFHCVPAIIRVFLKFDRLSSVSGSEIMAKLSEIN